MPRKPKSRLSERLRVVEEQTHRRIAIYLRRSTDEDHQPFSLEAQQTKLRAFVESQPGNWQIVKVYSDDASGATLERPDLTQALRAARAGAFDTLLVYRVDRLSRRLRDLVGLLDDLADTDVVFRSATEPLDTSTPVGRMLVQMLGVFAEFEREIIIDRVIAGMERKAAKGLWNGGARPLGYRIDRDTWKLVPTEPEAGTVRAIFDLYVRDRLGTAAIANTLNQRGLRTRMGKAWSAHTVETVIKNRVYLGEKIFRDIAVVDAHPALIPVDQFTEAQAILTARATIIGKRAANPSDYTLTGLIRCPDCGRGYIGTAANGRSRRYRYYTCWTRVRYGTDAGCRIHRYHADPVEAAIGQALLDLYTHHTDVLNEALAAFAHTHAATTTELQDQLGAVEREVRDNRHAVDRYLTAFERGTLDDEDDQIRTRLAALRSQRKQLIGRKAELELALQEPPTRIAPAELDLVRAHIQHALASGSTNVRKALFEQLIHKITVDADDALTPTFRIPAIQTPEDQTEGKHTAQRADALVRALTTMVDLDRFEPVRTWHGRAGCTQTTLFSTERRLRTRPDRAIWRPSWQAAGRSPRTLPRLVRCPAQWRSTAWRGVW